MSGMDTSIAYDVVLLPDANRAVAYRKRAADDGCSLMGVTVAAFGAWVRDLWELYGDGRAFVSRLEREALLRAACERPVDGAGASAGAGETGALGLDRVAAACGAAGAGLLFGASEALQLRLQMSSSINISSYIILMLPYLMALLFILLVGKDRRHPAAMGKFYKQQ